MQLCKARLYTKLGLHRAYILLSITPGDDLKTAFWAIKELFESLVISLD